MFLEAVTFSLSNCQYCRQKHCVLSLAFHICGTLLAFFASSLVLQTLLCLIANGLALQLKEQNEAIKFTRKTVVRQYTHSVVNLEVLCMYVAIISTTVIIKIIIIQHRFVNNFS